MAKLGGTVLLNGTRVRRKVDFVNDTTTYGNKILDLGILQDNFPNGYFNKTGIRGSIPNNSAIYPKRTYLYSSVSPEDAYNNGTLTDTLIENTDWDADSVNNINTTSTYFFLSPTQVAPAGYYMATTGGDTRTYYTVTGSLGKVTSISTYTPVTHDYEFSVSPARTMFILHSSTSFQILVTSKKNGAAWPVSEDDVSIGRNLMQITCGGVDYQGDGVYSFSFSCRANVSTSQRTATLTFTQPGSQLTAETSVEQAASPIHPSDPDLPIIEV